MNWNQIKALKPSQGRFVPLSIIHQGKGRNGRKHAQRAGKPKWAWRYVA